MRFFSAIASFSLVDERKRRANQRLQSPTPPRTKAESATRAALIASKHALCVTDPKAVYPVPEGAWACNMCKRTAHSWWRMWHCTRDGCNHHECDACHEYCPRERAACVEHALPPYGKEAKVPHGMTVMGIFTLAARSTIASIKGCRGRSTGNV